MAKTARTLFRLLAEGRIDLERAISEYDLASTPTSATNNKLPRTPSNNMEVPGKKHPFDKLAGGEPIKGEVKPDTLLRDMDANLGYDGN